MKSMLIAALCALALPITALSAEGAPSRYQDVTRADSTTANGDRAIRLSIDLAASPAAVWAAFTDPDTIRIWGAPLAIIDLRNGGSMEESYLATAKAGDPENIRHEILAVAPANTRAMGFYEATGWTRLSVPWGIVFTKRP